MAIVPAHTRGRQAELCAADCWHFVFLNYESRESTLMGCFSLTIFPQQDIFFIRADSCDS